MKEHTLRIVFMGTPEFAVPSLNILLQNKYEILAVVTATDKPAGRGLKAQESAVKKFAVANSIPVLQPDKLKDTSFINELKTLRPDLQVVVAFRMLPEIVWSLPEKGTVNLHASLLPQYRGAAPINWAIIKGEKDTGLTTFQLQKEIDTGKILFQEKETISESDSAGDLHDRLMLKGASLLLKTVEAIELGQLSLTDQSAFVNPGVTLNTAPRIFREDCELNWSLKGMDLYNLIRGLSPYPGAWCELKDEKGKKNVLKIFASEFIPQLHHAAHGDLFTDRATFLRIAVVDGFIGLKSVQLEGKKRMAIGDFLIGQQNIQHFSFKLSS
jgi:methionyl-tRNA formyltransferase